VRFELGAYALMPNVKVIAPWREWDLTSRETLLAYAEQHGIPVDFKKRKGKNRRTRWTRTCCTSPTRAASSRTFAIISHPDAGKTTLTEKLLLFGGAIQMAGTSRRARRAACHLRLDGNGEGARHLGDLLGDAVPYRERIVNLLDTPGHEDFSEDTYRVLTAVDSALMVIDGAKGVEERTIKLMDVCRLRDTPIISFVNKLDREGATPSSCSTRSSVLKIQCAPVTWPIGMGKRVSRASTTCSMDEVHLYEPGRNFTAPGLDVHLQGPRRPGWCAGRHVRTIARATGTGAGRQHPSTRPPTLPGRQAPVFFGTALGNFGVRELLDASSSGRRRRARGTTTRRGAAERSSAASCSRSRRTWTRSTATASPSCASAPAATRRA
jgi:peptide chain release factor 3